MIASGVCVLWRTHQVEFRRQMDQRRGESQGHRVVRNS